jgi:Fic family protein
VKPPPFTITSEVLESCFRIGLLVGRLTGLAAERPQPQLRRENRVRTVRGTVGIEGNLLSEEQVTAVLDGKRVIGPQAQVLEVQNAIAAYDRATSWDPWSQKDLLAAHAVLLKGLAADAGRWRSGGVGVMQGTRVAHVAPPARQVPRLMANLLEWGARAHVPTLIKAAVVHYEIQSIHPFSDGNGRLGRLWQHVILLGVSPVFDSVPAESVIQARQAAYYAALGASDQAGDCTTFLEYTLAALLDALELFVEEVRPERETSGTRLEAARQALGKGWFTRADYRKLHRRLSTATASRDLKDGVDRGLLRREGDRRNARYAFKPG